MGVGLSATAESSGLPEESGGTIRNRNPEAETAIRRALALQQCQPGSLSLR
jgi:hypothetical protein